MSLQGVTREISDDRHSKSNNHGNLDSSLIQSADEASDQSRCRSGGGSNGDEGLSRTSIGCLRGRGAVANEIALGVGTFEPIARSDVGSTGRRSAHANAARAEDLNPPVGAMGQGALNDTGKKG